MARLEPKVKPCKGGMVQIGIFGQGSSVYATKFMLCVSAFQDERYGEGLRLHTQSGKNPDLYRCTVCGFGNGILRH